MVLKDIPVFLLGGETHLQKVFSSFIFAEKLYKRFEHTCMKSKVLSALNKYFKLTGVFDSYFVPSFMMKYNSCQKDFFYIYIVTVIRNVQHQ